MQVAVQNFDDDPSLSDGILCSLQRDLDLQQNGVSGMDCTQYDVRSSSSELSRKRPIAEA